MKHASDFRKKAREALHGKWILAVAAGLVLSFLGGVGTTTFSFVNLRDYFNVGQDIEGTSNLGTVWLSEIQGLFPYGKGSESDSKVTAFVLGTVLIVALVALVFMVLRYILNCIVSLGYARFYLNLIDDKRPSIETLLSYFPHWKTAVVVQLLQFLYIALWSILFIVPGIMAIYSYAMTEYILAEHPELTASEAIARSKAMMKGNRWRLFCLEFSFIGWEILCILTFGIGNLVLTPYEEAATAAFYRDLCDGTVLQAES